MFEKEVIILGTTHHNTLGIIRSIGAYPDHFHIVLVLYGESESYLTTSKYVKSHYFVKSADEICNQLLALAKEKKQVVIATTDEAVYQLDMNAQVLSPYFEFFGTEKRGDLTRYMDKVQQDGVAIQAGLNVPENYTPDNIVFPCLLKPQASIAGGKRVLICDNAEEYEKSVSQYPDTKFQIQQYLHKEKEIVLVGLSVNGNVDIPAYVLKHREMAGATTYSTVHPIDEMDPLLVTKTIELVKTIGYEGLFGVEFMFCEDKYWFIEINLRSDATCYAVTVAGVNLPLAYVLAKQGKDVQKVLNAPIRVIDSMVEFRDFEFVLRREIGFLSWLRQRNRCKCHYFYNKADSQPYRVNRKKLWKRIVNKVLK